MQRFACSKIAALRAACGLQGAGGEQGGRRQEVAGALKQSSSALSHGDGGEAGGMEGVVAAKPKKTRNANGSGRKPDEKTFGIFARLGIKRSRTRRTSLWRGAEWFRCLIGSWVGHEASREKKAFVGRRLSSGRIAAGVHGGISNVATMTPPAELRENSNS